MSFPSGSHSLSLAVTYTYLRKVIFTSSKKRLRFQFHFCRVDTLRANDEHTCSPNSSFEVEVGLHMIYFRLVDESSNLAFWGGSWRHVERSGDSL